ncbi:hypothetical protein OROGR_004740 [Orobanche gracilis]
MSVRGVWQLQKLVVGFCNWGGSSRGIRMRVFRSQDYTVVLYCLRQPQASRSTSAEIYVLGLKYKAPAKIDPRLLDVKHLFQGGKEPPKVVDVFRVKKDKRHRVGYEDGDTTLRKLCSASDFIWSATPLDVLGTVASITFKDPESSAIKDHTLTTEEVKILYDVWVFWGSKILSIL